MREIRIHHPEPLADSTTVSLSDTARRHVSSVLRLRDGAAIVLFDGSGREWPAVLEDARHGTARTGAAVERATESPLAVTLVQGIARGERMDWAIQKAVELGVTRIVPVDTERGGVRLDAARAAKRHAHWQGVVIAACEQSGRARVPTVDAPTALRKALPGLGGVLLVLDPAANLPLAAAPVEHGRGVSLLVGPEGGFSATELTDIIAAGGIGVRLGPRVLRTETAGVAALAALQTSFGDLSV